MRALQSLFTTGTLLLAACATSPLVTEKSTSSIRAAEEVGADKVPRAALHLQYARESLEKARALAKDGQKDAATSMLMRSEADAELAIALSREDAERQEAEAAVQRVHELRKANL
jgi:hypothetical protein